MPLGVPSLTATLNNAGFVTLVAQCTAAATVTITRTIGGSTVDVVTAGDMTAGGYIHADYDLPQATTYTYRATVDDGIFTATTAPVTISGLDRGGDYIAAFADPFNGTVINVESFTEDELRAQNDEVTVLGRPDPVVVAFGRTWARGELVLISTTDEERHALESIFETGRLVVFQARRGAGIDRALYLAPGDVSVQRVSRMAFEPARRWLVNVQRVAAPPAEFTVPFGQSWQDVVDAGYDWSWWDANGSFLDLAGVV